MQLRCGLPLSARSRDDSRRHRTRRGNRRGGPARGRSGGVSVAWDEPAEEPTGGRGWWGWLAGKWSLRDPICSGRENEIVSLNLAGRDFPRIGKIFLQGSK